MNFKPGFLKEALNWGTLGNRMGAGAFLGAVPGAALGFMEGSTPGHTSIGLGANGLEVGNVGSHSTFGNTVRGALLGAGFGAGIAGGRYAVPQLLERAGLTAERGAGEAAASAAKANSAGAAAAKTEQAAVNAGDKAVAENAAKENASAAAKPAGEPVRPKRKSFATEEEYNKAFDEYEKNFPEHAAKHGGPRKGGNKAKAQNNAGSAAAGPRVKTPAAGAAPMPEAAATPTGNVPGGSVPKPPMDEADELRASMGQRYSAPPPAKMNPTGDTSPIFRDAEADLVPNQPSHRGQPSMYELVNMKSALGNRRNTVVRMLSSIQTRVNLKLASLAESRVALAK